MACGIMRYALEGAAQDARSGGEFPARFWPGTCEERERERVHWRAQPSETCRPTCPKVQAGGAPGAGEKPRGGALEGQAGEPWGAADGPPSAERTLS